MRKILFRGKRLDNGEWVYGLLVDILKECARLRMVVNGFVKYITVKSSTIGQYTGLTDKNGKKIFEGDIIFDPETKENYIVEFDEGGFCAGDMFLQAYISFDEFDSEVIGNIHDNPELLKGGRKSI